MSIVDCVQGTDQWFAARLGVATASNFHRIITPKGGPSDQQYPYMYMLIAEKLLNERMEERKYRSRAMEYGTAHEADAAAAFSRQFKCELAPVGFITCDGGRLGASPDRLIKGRNEAVEIKCPEPWTHLRYLCEGVGEDYQAQVQGQMLVGGFDKVHFWSWSEHWPAYHKEVERDDAYILRLDKLLREFLKQMDERRRLLRDKHDIHELFTRVRDAA